jgi:hypothetical protein
MKSAHRTCLSIALFTPLACLLLITFACLPAPVGDPEKSKIDENLAGIYQQVPQDPASKDVNLAILKPWDSRTYMLNYMVLGKQNDKETHELKHFKVWLTTIEGKTFLTAQPMDDLQFALGKDEQAAEPFWAVLRIDKVPSGLELRMLNRNSEFLKNLTKQAEIEAAIKAHVSDNDLYAEPVTFKKLDKSDRALIADVLSKFDTSIDKK